LIFYLTLRSRFEGRNWYTPVRGRLWICAGAKVPQDDLIDQMRSTYAHISKGEVKKNYEL